MDYPQFRASDDGMKTYKLVDEEKRTLIKIHASEDFYCHVGITDESEEEILETTVEISDGDFDDVMADVNDCARYGTRPIIRPH